jgi:hypothetical protein
MPGAGSATVPVDVAGPVAAQPLGSPPAPLQVPATPTARSVSPPSSPRHTRAISRSMAMTEAQRTQYLRSFLSLNPTDGHISGEENPPHLPCLVAHAYVPKMKHRRSGAGLFPAIASARERATADLVRMRSKTR